VTIAGVIDLGDINRLGQGAILGGGDFTCQNLPR